MWKSNAVERPDAMAVRLVAESEQMSSGQVLDIVGLLLDCIIAPPLAPFLIAAAVVSVPLDKVGKWLTRGDRAMPHEWYAHVEAMGSDDGRFFVGRTLKEKGKATMSDALRYVAIEKWAKRSEPDAELLVHSEDARKALMDHYLANQTLFDKAMSTIISGTTSGIAAAVGATVSTSINVLSAVKRKIDVGF